MKINQKVIFKPSLGKSIISIIKRETNTLFVLDNDVKIYKKTLTQVKDKYSKLYPINSQTIKAHKKNQYSSVVFPIHRVK